MHPENENEPGPGTRDDQNRPSSGTSLPSDRDSSSGDQCASDRGGSSDRSGSSMQKPIGDERSTDKDRGEPERSDPHQ